MREKALYADPTVTVKVVGGLGNQLFCFFAGRYLALATNSRLIVDMSDIRNGRSVHNSSIDELNLVGKFIHSDYSKKKHFFTRLIRKAKEFGFVFDSKVYFSKVVGFDSNLDQLTAPVTLNGYFQSYKYFYHQRESFQTIEPRSPSDWFVKMAQVFDSTNVTVIHIRRGDYKALKDTYGLLDSSYYSRCLSELRKLGINFPIYVFSDDIDEAKAILSEIVDEHPIWVRPPSVSSPCESLVLMSKAKVNVIANSTFSWWAAALNQKNSIVFAPNKWFKDMNDPDQLYPPEWRLIESSWEI